MVGNSFPTWVFPKSIFSLLNSSSVMCCTFSNSCSSSSVWFWTVSFLNRSANWSRGTVTFESALRDMARRGVGSWTFGVSRLGRRLLQAFGFSHYFFLRVINFPCFTIGSFGNQTCVNQTCLRYQRSFRLRTILRRSTYLKDLIMLMGYRVGGFIIHNFCVHTMNQIGNIKHV